MGGGGIHVFSDLLLPRADLSFFANLYILRDEGERNHLCGRLMLHWNRGKDNTTNRISCLEFLHQVDCCNDCYNKLYTTKYFI